MDEKILLMKIGNHPIYLDPFMTQQFPRGKGKVIAVGKDKRYPEHYGKHHWYVLVRYDTGKKEVFIFDWRNKFIKSEEV